MPDVSVIVPCFNEAENLPELEIRLRDLVARRNESWEVILVNDGSQDHTADLVDAFARRYPWASALHHGTNRGLGAAMRTGFSMARGAVVCTIDSDCTYPPERLPELIDAVLAGADVATASPWHPDVHRSDASRWRTALSQTASLLYRVILGQRVYTFTAMFRCYRREVVERVAFDANGFSSVTEILVRSLLAGFRLAEVPMPLGARRFGESKMSVGRAVAGHLELLSKCVKWRFQAV